MKAHFKRFVMAGPGGMKCSCCGGRMKKHLILRIAKRRERIASAKQARQESSITRRHE